MPGTAPLLRLALVGLLAAACTDPGAAPSPSPAVASTPAPSAPSSIQETAAPRPEAAAIPLAYRFAVGDRWTEEVEMTLHSSRSGEPPSETPTMLERRRERFEVLADAGEGPVLAILLEHLEIEPRGAAAIDSDAPPPTGADPFLFERLAFVGAPIRVRVDASGEVLETLDERLVRDELTRRWTSLREAAGLPPTDDEAAARWQRALDAEFAANREWGARPRLPRAPEPPGATWTETVTTTTLFDAAATWTIRHTLRDIDGDLATVVRDGDAEFAETAAFARYLRKADVGLTGEHVLDRGRGVLLRSETIVEGMIEAAPQVEHGFEGGTLKMRRSLKRRRVDP
ncbi:MAG: hypothetical protein R3B09_17295 [Nannocystaceae bacterium]